MRQTINTGSEQLRVRVRDLERENEALGSRVTELQRRLRHVEAATHPLNVRLARAQTASPVA